ncbi:Flagellar motor rotation protein MotB [Actinacidiphila cocklensis]|uniref:Flagellar motor rotation protein MotB n=1 Tax=Actinacidiphila cocklensis TaxID=887465 RepID=A0A9W4GU95_9ACTN|nr:Flagellar motor rotation protein MotB [Actinacidiphila cocklensis]
MPSATPSATPSANAPSANGDRDGGQLAATGSGPATLWTAVGGRRSAVGGRRWRRARRRCRAALVGARRRASARRG